MTAYAHAMIHVRRSTQCTHMNYDAVRVHTVLPTLYFLHCTGSSTTRTQLGLQGVGVKSCVSFFLLVTCLCIDFFIG